MMIFLVIVLVIIVICESYFLISIYLKEREIYRESSLVFKGYVYRLGQSLNLIRGTDEEIETLRDATLIKVTDVNITVLFRNNNVMCIAIDEIYVINGDNNF